MGEHLPCKQGVKGSNPFISTRHQGKDATDIEKRIGEEANRAHETRENKGVRRGAQEGFFERVGKEAIQREITDLRNSCKRTVQATKSTRGMPWHREPKKDVTNCDKLRGAVSRL